MYLAFLGTKLERTGNKVMANKLKIDVDQVDDIRVMTSEVVTAYLGRNQLSARDLSGLIVEVFDTLNGLGGAAASGEEESSDAGGGAVAEAQPAPASVAEPEPDPEEAEEPAPQPEPVADDKGQTPAVPIEKSVTDDLIYCLENGKGYKTLKRHLWSSYGLTPEAYRKKWNLPKDYPLVAPNYSKRRAATAKEIGLGRKPRKG